MQKLFCLLNQRVVTLNQKGFIHPGRRQIVTESLPTYRA